MAQKKGKGLLFAALQGVAGATIGSAIADFGHISAGKEAIFFSAGIIFLAAAMAVFYKYKLGGNINPAITNPKVRSFLTRYPLFPVCLGMLMGIAVMVLLMRLVDAA